MHPDCLICLEKVKETWRPPTPCICKINIHEKCWILWENRAGPRCIICRILLVPQEEEEQEQQPQPEELERHIGKPCLRVSLFLALCALVWVFLKMIQPKPFVFPERTWQNDEL